MGGAPECDGTLPDVPEATVQYGLKLERAYFSSNLVPRDDEPVLTDVCGCPVRSIQGGAELCCMKPAIIRRLRREWRTRPDDVFLVYPTAGLLHQTTRLCIGLVEQREMTSIDMDFPRFVDAAASRRGWGYMDAVDKWATRRTFTTRATPSRFPSRSLRALPTGALDTADAQNVGPKIAVFVADPRYSCMKSLEIVTFMNRSGSFRFGDFIGAQCKTADPGELNIARSLGLANAVEWAYAEASDPERVRIFFLEDFALQPEVAVRGLVRFLSVPSCTNATDAIVHGAEEIMGLDGEAANAACLVGSISQHVHQFERLLAESSPDVRDGWRRILQPWLQSPNHRMASMAELALEHGDWDPPRWWAAHCARVCRPCIFFPRGACMHDRDCDHCHGPGHPKPKRASRARRARRHRYDRTPSPPRPSSPPP